jgi:hypothetical protein
MVELGKSMLSYWALSLIVRAWNYQQRASQDINLVSLSHPCYYHVSRFPSIKGLVSSWNAAEIKLKLLSATG